MNGRKSFNINQKFTPQEKGPLYDNMGATYFRIFKLYLDMVDREKALVYGEKALSHFRKSKEVDKLSFILEQMGDLYDFFNCFDKAMNCYSECEKLKNQS